MLGQEVGEVLRGGIRNHPKGATSQNGWRQKSNKKVISEPTNK